MVLGRDVGCAAAAGMSSVRIDCDWPCVAESVSAGSKLDTLVKADPTSKASGASMEMCLGKGKKNSQQL